MIDIRPILDIISEVQEELASLDLYSGMQLSKEERKVFDSKFNKLSKVYVDLVGIRDKIVDYNMVR